MTLAHTVLIVAAFIAGAQNALAGGGSFITFPALLYAGFDARAANITSAVALFPGTVATGIAGRRLVTGAEGLSVATLVLLSLLGGALGALLLVATPVAMFNRIVPYLVPLATAVFAWGSFFRKPRAAAAPHLGPRAAACALFMIAIYGGYFAGGIGFLMLAALTAAGSSVRNAGATKNMLASMMGASSVLVFLFQVKFDWRVVAPAAAAAVLGGQLGVYLLRRINETALCIGITLIGIGLTVALFVRS